jgi:hypothetical protein
MVTGAHHASHDPGRNLDDELHDAEVIEHGEKRANENNGRQHLKRKIKAEMGALLTQVAENKLRAGIGIAKQSTDGIASPLKNPLPSSNSQHANRKGELQAQAPGHGLQPNCTPIG